MKYILLIRRHIHDETLALFEDLATRGRYLGGSPMGPPSSAGSVRVRAGKRLVTDGPFAETRELLGG
jgi:hypothetical protein